MSPTFQDGDRVLVLRYWKTTWLRKGQIVIVYPRHFPQYSSGTFRVDSPYIKRITGMPGDVIVSSIDELLEILKLAKPHLLKEYDVDGKRTWTVPPGHFFVRGDKPVGGFDSLSWGPIPYSSLLGVVVMRLTRQTESVSGHTILPLS